ncbi:MAG: TRAP transporter substrate-binding protein DctP [Myxococcota bacterium]
MRRTLLATASLACFLLGGAAFAQTFKMGTMAPEGSTWHQALKRISEQWAAASSGAVKLKIFAGGVQGDEGDTIKKMRIGQLQAAAITAVGLRDISPEPQAISCPMMIQSYEELDYVMERVGPKLEKAVEDRGFVVLAWTDTGIMYFFSRKPAATPQEMFPQKVFAVRGDPVAEEAWRIAGFTPVVLSSVEMIPSLQTGMIDAFTSTTLVALSLGWYSSAPNMTQYPWGTLIGALVVSKQAWDKVPAELRPKLLEIARKEGNGLRPEARRQDAESVKVMQSKGLNVVKPTPAQAAEWAKLEAKIFPAVRGKVVPEAIFDEVKKTRDEFRAQKK